MLPEDAARQLEYVVASQLETDSCGHWERGAYQQVFEDTHDRGTSEDVISLVEKLGTEFEDGRRPTLEQAQRHADTLLTEGGRPLTDGGDE